MLSFTNPLLLSAISSTLLASGITFAAPTPMQAYPQGQSSDHGFHYGLDDDSDYHEGDPEVADYQGGEQAQMNPTPKKLVFFSSDGKVDDNLAIALAGYTGKYDDAHIFHDGITDHYQSMMNTEHLQAHLESTIGPFIHLNKYHYTGETPLTNLETGEPIRQDHENHFFDDGTKAAPYLYGPEYLANNLGYYEGQERKADFFSQSPMPMEALQQRLQTIYNSGIELETFHHILGYNTRQDSLSKHTASDDTQLFAVSLQSMVHRFFPNCKVIITNSYLNLGGPPGATQDFEKLERILPAFALEAIGPLDTFYMNQMRASTGAIIKNKFKPKYFVGVDGKSPITQAEIWQARRNINPKDPATQFLRANTLNVAHYNLKCFDRLEEEQKGKGRNMASRMKSLINGIESECQGEACDFNHQALVHAADIKHKMLGVWPYKPMKLKENVMSDWAGPNEISHGLSPNKKLGLQHGTTQWYLNQMTGTPQTKETERFNPYKEYKELPNAH